MAEPYTRCGRHGDTIWQRNRYGQIHYLWRPRKDRKTPAQCCVRMNFGDVSAYWRKLAEPQRLSWCVAGKGQKTRRRLGKRYPMTGYMYYMRINVALANRGQPLLELPPGDPPPAGLSFPLLTSLYYRQPEHLLALCAQAKSRSAGLALPSTG